MASRRRFLKLAAAAGALASPATIARALSIAPARRTGTIMDVEHVVIFMQENRSFDHYFGMMRGVRGFSDPRPIDLPNAGSVWGQGVLPFHLDTKSTSAEHMASLDHSWKGSHATWKDHDAWVRVKGEMTMGYFTSEDLPFYYALADAFTVCDAYHCSIFGPTSPNRNFLFTGTSGLSAGYSGELVVRNANKLEETSEVADPAHDTAWEGLGWTTYAERLEKAGVSWKLYQEWDNYGDNALAYFKAFRGAGADPALMRKGRGLVEGSNADNAKTSRGEPLIAALKRDVQNKTLPQVSWVVGSYLCSEHPSATPSVGENLTAGLIDALTSDPETWAKTVFILNYDENDGFFDHVPPPMPAVGTALGKSTVAVADELYGKEPVGLGARVPAVVVSPWSRGGYVNSEVFDHTSVIRFLEKRFGVMEPNIGAWRRAVCGDLTSCFDFAGDEQPAATLPDTSHYLERAEASKALPPARPVKQDLPRQERGQRPSRALGYDLDVRGRIDAKTKALIVDFINNGRLGVCFDVRSPAPTLLGPWFYTVEPGKRLSDAFPIESFQALSVRGPDGFVYEARGSLDHADLLVSLTKHPSRHSVEVTVHNTGDRPHGYLVRHVAYGAPPGDGVSATLAPGQKGSHHFDVSISRNWYEVRVDCDGALGFMHVFKGRLDDGKPGVSDPLIGI